MPQVPYRPYPTEQPAFNPTPELQIRAPAAAFGAATAEAVKGVGGQLSHAGDVFAERALAAQGLINETWAKDADVTAMERIGQAEAEYNQLEGTNAVQQLPAHQARIKRIREDVLGAAPNAMARKLADTTITRRVGFALVDAGSRAGQQAKVAANRASDGRLETAVNAFDPNNPMSAGTIKSEVRYQADVHGDHPETTANIERKKLSQGWLNWVTRNAPLDPEGVKNKVEKHKDELDTPTYEQMQKVINTQMTLKDTRIEANRVLTGFDPMKGAGQLDGLLEQGRKIAEKKGKDNSLYADYLENHIRQGYNLGMQAYKDKQVDNYQKVTEFVHGKDWQSKITSIDAVAGPNAPPEIRTAWEGLEPTKKNAIEAQINRLNRNVPYTADRQANFNRLMGIAIRNPQEFVQMDVGSEDLPRSKIDALMREQRNIQRRGELDKTVLSAMHEVSNLLRQNGLRPDQPEWDQFRGAFYQEVKTWQDEHKQPMKYDDYYKLASRLLQTRPGSGYFGTTFGGSANYTIPEAHRKVIIERFKKDNDGAEPTEQEIRFWYNRKLDEEREAKRPSPAEKPRVGSDIND